MLVVLVLISMLTGLAVLSVSGNASRRVQEEGERLQEVLQAASDESVLQGSELGVTLAGNHYAVVRYDATNHVWEALEDKPFRTYALPDDVRLEIPNQKELSTVMKNDPQRPVIIFFSSGEATPFRLSLSSPGNQMTIVIAGDGVSPIAMQQAGRP